jgi:hypothetical protein
MFMERSTIETWAAHLNLIVERFISGAEAIGSYHGLGQSAVVLHKP